jgi:hypothetical protein
VWQMTLGVFGVIVLMSTLGLAAGFKSYALLLAPHGASAGALRHK